MRTTPRCRGGAPRHARVSRLPSREGRGGAPLAHAGQIYCIRTKWRVMATGARTISPLWQTRNYCPRLPPYANSARLIGSRLRRSLSKMLALLAASCQVFVAVGAPSTVASRRAAAPQANLFDTLGKIADYNKKYFGTMAAGLMDKRTARASHVLFGFAKYEDGEKRAADLKLALDSGEITFADAAKARLSLTRHPPHPVPSAPHGSGSHHTVHHYPVHGTRGTAACVPTQEFSTCPSAAKGGDLGTFKRGAMVPEFDSTVFSEETQLGSMSCV